ncbi:hypothetical protein GIY62_00635 [Burkholderia plantarii]|uniref:hypothetical protein n=1 Tax=Burkholderia plantarii TaxID=41899 RepID=UPI00272AE10D|nr:hypothetical protein [Burkholderia plantarii]WLE59248.1 hypothetical protein GIY62_00635 [Burkholderia plantarii]
MTAPALRWFGNGRSVSVDFGGGAGATQAQQFDPMQGIGERPAIQLRTLREQQRRIAAIAAMDRPSAALTKLAWHERSGRRPFGWQISI